MSEQSEFRCPHIETCPNVLQACERKVKAETQVSVLQGRIAAYEEDMAAYATKRDMMNRLYKTGVRLRKCQNAYFKARTKEALVSSKNAEKDFDDVLKEIEQLKGGAK